MAASKLVQINQKIEEQVTIAFRKINDAVVGRYTRIEDAFTDAFLTREGESAAEAKARLKEETVRK